MDSPSLHMDTFARMPLDKAFVMAGRMEEEGPSEASALAKVICHVGEAIAVAIDQSKSDIVSSVENIDLS